MKASRGNFLEDFRLGFEIRHATPRTVTEGDIALYRALYGGRFALAGSAEFAAVCGLKPRPVDDLLVFRLVLGMSDADISTHALADLGCGAGRFGPPVHPGDTLFALSKVIGIEESADRTAGTVDLLTTGYNQQGETVLSFMRRVVVAKRDPAAAGPAGHAPCAPPDRLSLDGLDFSHYDPVLAGSPHFWEDYAPGERIDHLDAAPVEEPEHRLAARLCQESASERRQIRGGHVLSLARSLSFNGLGNAVKIAAINRIRPAAACSAGDLLRAWSRIEEKKEFPRRPDIGALRIRTFAVRNRSCADFPGDGADHPDLLLEFDYTVLMPRRF